MNRRKDGLAAVEQYLGHEHAYLSMGNIQKLGVKPLFGHTTPLGIYAYPLHAQDVIDCIKDKGLTGLPYRGDERFANIIIADVPDARMFSVYTNAARVEDQLRYVANEAGIGFLWQRILAEADEQIKRKGVAERSVRAYEASRGLAFYVAVKRAWGLEKMKTPSFLNRQDRIMDGEFEDFKAAGPWNGILRKIGFDAVTDEGVGYIHWHEESQTCFLSTKPMRNVMRIEVSSDEYPHKIREIGSVRGLMRMVSNDNLDPIETMHILDAMINHRGTPVGYTEYSYRPGICPTPAEARAIVGALKRLHPNTMKAWGTPRMNDVMVPVFDYIEDGFLNDPLSGSR